MTIAKPMQNIEKNLIQVKNHISQAALEFNRDARGITLLAVSKTKPVDDIERAFKYGQRDFGENYLQEAEQKITVLNNKLIVWHYIGPIQSNKTRKISELFDWVHSVDRLKIAVRLNEQRPLNKPPLNILLQVNIDEESSKSGIHPDEVMLLAEKISQLQHICLRGLMAIPSIHTGFDQQRIPLAKMHAVFDKLRASYPTCDTLSMGMTNDLEAAIAEGSTLVRIGTAIFGSRNYP